MERQKEDPRAEQELSGLSTGTLCTMRAVLLLGRRLRNLTPWHRLRLAQIEKVLRSRNVPCNLVGD